jgi:hypothetical protein
VRQFSWKSRGAADTSSLRRFLSTDHLHWQWHPRPVGWFSRKVDASCWWHGSKLRCVQMQRASRQSDGKVLRTPASRWRPIALAWLRRRDYRIWPQSIKMSRGEHPSNSHGGRLVKSAHRFILTCDQQFRTLCKRCPDNSDLGSCSGRTPGFGSRFADHSVEHKLVAGQALLNDAKSTAT